jgi:hypothetical protein
MQSVEEVKKVGWKANSWQEFCLNKGRLSKTVVSGQKHF